MVCDVEFVCTGVVEVCAYCCWVLSSCADDSVGV